MNSLNFCLFLGIIVVFNCVYFIQATDLCPTLTGECGAIDCIRNGTKVYAILNGKCEEFSNGCNLAVTNCFREQNGQKGRWKVVKRCRDGITKACNSPNEPICATDGCEFKTFSNSCAMKEHNCDNQSKFAFYKKGTCRCCAK